MGRRFKSDSRLKWYNIRMNSCVTCNNKPARPSYKYCSNKCQKEYQYAQYIKKWQSGLVSGDGGIVTKSISRHIKCYLIEIYGEKCSVCEWSIKYQIIGRVRLEVDYINGNSEDNREENLRLICPNCHSLSSNFRNLNRGKGRAWRMLKYIKNID